MKPATDQKIAQRYSATTLEKKGKNKTSLQEELGWPLETKRPVVCLPAGMSESLGGKLLEEVMAGLLSLPVEILILGKGSKEYGEYFTKLASEQGHRVAIIPNEDVNIRKMLAASDFALFCADADGMPEVDQCLEYGVVPIAPASGSLKDYNPVQESGNAFIYDKKDVWGVFGALVRAVETHRFPFDWRTIQKHCMGSAKA